MLGCLNLFLPAHGKKELISVLWHENLLRTWISGASNTFSSSTSTKISSPDALCTQRISNEDAWKDIWAKLVESHFIFRNQSTTRRVMLASEISLQNALRKEFSFPIRGLDRFAENSNIRWNQPNIFHPNQIAEVPRMHLLSPCVLVALQYHLSQTDEALKYNDSTTDLHKSLQCPANCL